MLACIRISIAFSEPIIGGILVIPFVSCETIGDRVESNSGSRSDQILNVHLQKSNSARVHVAKRVVPTILPTTRDFAGEEGLI
jgi:hypothetical protein